jgi:hypothetical protein
VGDDVIVRVNLLTGEIEKFEVLFFSRRRKQSQLFEVPIKADLCLSMEASS